MRQRRLAVAAALAAMLLAPAASAGTETAPEVADVADKADPAMDLLSAWFQGVNGGVMFTIKFAGADAPTPNAYYAMVFYFQGTWYVPVVGFDENGQIHSDIRGTNFNRQGIAGPGAFRDTLESVVFEPGAPATVSAVIPKDAIVGLADGASLVDISAEVGRWTARDGWDDVDSRTTNNAYVYDESILPAFVVRNSERFTAGAIVALGAAGATFGYLVWRRHQNAKRATAEPAQES